MEQVVPNYSIVVQAIIFFISLFIIKRFILDPISEILQQRTAKIEGGEKEARRVEEEANELDSSYRQEIQDARVKAMVLRYEMRQEALAKEKELLKSGSEEAHRILERIRQEISREVEMAKAMLHQQTSELAVRFSEKILGRKIQ